MKYEFIIDYFDDKKFLIEGSVIQLDYFSLAEKRGLGLKAFSDMILDFINKEKYKTNRIWELRQRNEVQN